MFIDGDLTGPPATVTGLSFNGQGWAVEAGWLAHGVPHLAWFPPFRLVSVEDAHLAQEAQDRKDATGQDYPRTTDGKDSQDRNRGRG